jgi:hypothetical protein
MTAILYKSFTNRFKLLISKRPDLITMTLGNIFTMRLIGNKTHGDLAEIAIAEFINQYMYDYRSIHVGKDLFRAKSQEEDITIVSELTSEKFSVSLKAYGDGPLQLSTDKNSRMFPLLQQGADIIDDKDEIKRIFDDEAFADFNKTNVLPLIYDEKKHRCNIMVFDYQKAKLETNRIVLEGVTKGRKHPVYRFYASDGSYICEVRYGNAQANALQRGFWTNTKNAIQYFDSVTDGWIDYTHNLVLVQLFSHALVSSKSGHEAALQIIKADIKKLQNLITGQIQ